MSRVVWTSETLSRSRGGAATLANGALHFDTKLFGSFKTICRTLSKLTCQQILREKQRGGENSGEGKTYHKAPPQKRFWATPLMIRFPPPLCSRNVILLRGNGHRPDESHFLRPPKLVLEGGLYSTFSPPPPQNRTIRFAPPLRIPKIPSITFNFMLRFFLSREKLVKIY